MRRAYPVSPMLPVLALLLAAPAVHAQSGGALLQRTMDTYQKLDSYEGNANVDVRVKANGRTVPAQSQSSLLRMKRPNKLYLEITSPKGSEKVYSDGQSFVMYLPAANTYVKTKTAPDMASMLALLARVGIGAQIDPLYCLSRKTLPPQLANAIRKPDTTMNGRPVYVVTANLKVTQAPASGVKAAPASKTAAPPVSVWTWYIDKSTNLFQRIESATPQTAVVHGKQNGQDVTRTFPIMLLMQHTVVKATPNATVSEAGFAFIPPSNSQQKPLPTQGKLLK